MRILVIGGTGVLSTDVVSKMLNEGNEVYLLNRGTRKNLIDPRATLLVGDVRNLSSEKLRKIISVVPDYDVVADFLSFNVEQLKKTLSYTDGLFKQFFFISSATAYKKSSEDEVITENTPIGNEAWSYAYNKSLCEEYLRKSDINFTIIRPYVTFSKIRIPFQTYTETYYYTLIARIKAGKPFPLYKEGENHCTITYSYDFANLFYGLVMNPKAFRNAYHLTSSGRYTWREIYETLCRILDCPVKVYDISLDEVKKYVPEYYETLLGDKGTNMVFDNSKVLADIGGYEFKYNLEDGLREAVDYITSHQKLCPVDQKWEGEMDYFLRKRYHVKDLKRINEGSNNSFKEKMKYSIMSSNILRPMYNFYRKLKNK